MVAQYRIVVSNKTEYKKKLLIIDCTVQFRLVQTKLLVVPWEGNASLTRRLALAGSLGGGPQRGGVQVAAEVPRLAVQCGGCR